MYFSQLSPVVKYAFPICIMPRKVYVKLEREREQELVDSIQDMYQQKTLDVGTWFGTLETRL